MDPNKSSKPSKLEQFKLFYEAVPAPSYMHPDKTDSDEDDLRKGKFRDRRISRRRK